MAETVVSHSVGDLRTPVTQLPAHDYGAETIRNYRYEFAYAVVLLVGAAAKNNAYTAVWCEQEDDVLAQITEKIFDGFQVKTREPELGAWECLDEPFVKAVKGFLALDGKYPGQMRRFHFVSNTECLESDAKGKKHLCPKRLAASAVGCKAYTEMAETEAKGFKSLLAKTGGSASALFSVLQRLGFVKAPSRESFIAELAQNHLRQLEWCRLHQAKLETIVRGLMEMVETASSLASQDPARHQPSGNGALNPQLLAKRITVEEFILRSRELANPHFRYLPSLTTSPLAKASKDLKTFQTKLHQGGLDDYADSMRSQLLSSESVLLDLVTRGEDGKADLTQIENVVKAQCDEARLRAERSPKPYGKQMLIEVQDRLTRVAREEGHKVGKQPYEVLMGMAGLLTESCPVWWSEKFNLEGQA
jgi:hypothetical protein